MLVFGCFFGWLRIKAGNTGGRVPCWGGGRAPPPPSFPSDGLQTPERNKEAG